MLGLNPRPPLTLAIAVLVFAAANPSARARAPRADDAIPKAAGSGSGTGSGAIVVKAPAPSNLLHLRAGLTDTTKLPNHLAADLPFDQTRRTVIQIDGPLTPEREAFLVAAGLILEEYLPDFAYIARTPAATPASLRQLGFVTWAGPFQDAWKLDPTIGAKLYASPDRQALSNAGNSQVVVVLFQGEDPKAAAAQITALGGQVAEQSQVGPRWMLDVTLATQTTRDVAAIPAVQFVEDAPQGALRNNSNRWILQSNAINFTPIWDNGITGQNQVAGVIDGTLGESHCMFDDPSMVPPGPTHRKVIAIRNGGGVDAHGTHVAGTVAGDAPPYDAYTTNDGMAFSAKITYSNVFPIYNNPSTFYPRLLDAHNDGARVHSNSWGDDSTRNYTIWSQHIDQFSWTYEDDTILFAVSNGANVTTPENAINVLAVAASSDTPMQNNHCMGGSGPTLDNRRKPEVLAPGCLTTSADPTTACLTWNTSGTSMACPAVAGGSILARQYFTDGFYPSGAATPADAFTPSGALVRAAVINSANDMSGVIGYPSNREGWGRVLLDNSLHFPSETTRLFAVDVRNAQGLTTGQTQTFYFYVNSPVQGLRATLVFTGPPAAINATDPVINDLDLEIESAAEGLYRGNVFTGSQSQTGGSADARNSVERFHRVSPAQGWYSLTVRATSVNAPSSPQGFAFVVTGDITAGCTPADVTDAPDDQTVAAGAAATFTAAAAGSADITYQWRKDDVDLADGANISGALTETLTIDPVSAADAGEYVLVATNFCGSEASTPALLTLANLCPADFNQSGAVTVQDLFDYLAAFFALDPAADFNQINGITVQDLFDYLAAFFTPCP